MLGLLLDYNFLEIKMGTVGIVLLIAFVIVSILLVLLVVIQDDGENGMGGLLGGRGTAAFGSHSASVLTKATLVLVVLFFVLAFALALVNRKPKIEKDLVTGTELAEEGETSETTASEWWKAEETDAE